MPQHNGDSLGGMESTTSGVQVRGENMLGSIIISLEKTKTNVTILTNVQGISLKPRLGCVLTLVVPIAFLKPGASPAHSLVIFGKMLTTSSLCVCKPS